MIYISKNNQVEIFTDNLVNFVPDELMIYLDDQLIGTFENLSESENYLRFIIPALDLTEREYKMKIFNHKALIKEELVQVQDFTKPVAISPDTSKNIVMYEK